MSYRRTPWGQLVEKHPTEARKRILTAFLATDGNTTQAARHLDVSHRSLCRYVKRLAIENQIKKIRNGTS